MRSCYGRLTVLLAGSGSVFVCPLAWEASRCWPEISSSKGHRTPCLKNWLGHRPSPTRAEPRLGNRCSRLGRRCPFGSYVCAASFHGHSAASFSTSGRKRKVRSRTKDLAWSVIGPQSILLTLPFAPLISFLPGNVLLVELYTVLQFLIQIAFAVWIMGKETRTVVRELINLPAVRWIGFAISIPAVLAVVLPVGRFIHGRMQWAAFGFGKVEAPYHLDYLPSPRWLLVFTLFFAAAFEEIVFWGALQSVLACKFGTFRGIFLTCLAWAAYHFYWDVNYLARRDDFLSCRTSNLSNRDVLCHRLCPELVDGAIRLLASGYPSTLAL